MPSVDKPTANTCVGRPRRCRPGMAGYCQPAAEQVERVDSFTVAGHLTGR